MATRFKRIIQTLVVNDISWLLIKPFVYLFKRLEASRNNFINADKERQLYEMGLALYPDRLVRRGIFKGMNMSGVVAGGSNYFAKLAGVYEEVLQMELERLLLKNYAWAVNIGSDEGYYAVGLALRAGLRVQAFDCNPKAMRNTGLLAKLNDVDDRVQIESCFSAEKLRAEQPVLFIVDCEGCEADIFTPSFVAKHRNSDFVIELHFAEAPEIDLQLKSVFEATHRVRLVTAIPDELIVRNCRLPEMEGLTGYEKMYLLGERPHFTQWLLAEALK